MIDLGRIDIITKVSLSSDVAFLREEHLEAAVHVMAQLVRGTSSKKDSNNQMEAMEKSKQIILMLELDERS